MGGAGGVFVHEKGLCESEMVGAGTRVWGFAHVMAGAVVGRDCNICGHSFIESGARIGNRVVIKNGVQVWDRVQIGDDVFVGPNASFTNDLRPRVCTAKADVVLRPTRLEQGVTIGANATLVCGIAVGREAFVAAGAVVIRDVPANALMAGNPARQIGWVCACGERLPEPLACACGRGYRLIDEHLGLELVS